MSKNNQVKLIGNVGGIDVLDKVFKFSLATNEYKKNGEEWEQTTEWHNAVCFGDVMESAILNIVKGSKLELNGRIKTEKYEKDGTTRYSTSIIVESFLMLAKMKYNESDDKSTQVPNNQNKNTHAPAGELDDLPF